MELKLYIDYTEAFMYKYNVVEVKDFFNKKYFKDAGKIGSLKKFLGVKTQKEADAYVMKLLDDYYTIVFEHLLTGNQFNLGKFVTIYIKEAHPELRHFRGIQNLNVVVKQNPMISKHSHKAYLFLPGEKFMRMVKSIFNPITGVTWKSQP